MLTPVHHVVETTPHDAIDREPQSPWFARTHAAMVLGDAPAGSNDVTLEYRCEPLPGSVPVVGEKAAASEPAVRPATKGSIPEGVRGRSPASSV